MTKTALLLLTALLLVPSRAPAQDLLRVDQVRGSLSVPSGWTRQTESRAWRIMGAQERPAGVQQDVRRKGRPPALLLVSKHKTCPKGAFTVTSNSVWGINPVDAASSALRRLGSEKRLLSRSHPIPASVAGRPAAYFRASWPSMKKCGDGVTHYEMWVIDNGRHWVVLSANYPTNFPNKAEVAAMVASLVLD